MDWFVSGSASLVAPGSGIAITATNPVPLTKIFRAGTQYQFTLNYPAGTTFVGWQIVDHVTRVVVTSGVTLTATWTPTFTSMLNTNVYDLIVTVSKSGTEYPRIFFGEIRVLPVKPTVADVTWSTSGNKDGSWTDRATGAAGVTNYAIKISSMAGRLNPFYWFSSDPTKWIYVYCDEGTVLTSDTFNFTPGPNQNVIWDFTGTTVKQGMRLSKNAAGTDQLFRWTASDATHNSKNVIFYGIECDGNSETMSGAAGWQVETSHDAVNEYETYTLDNVRVGLMWCHDTGGEGMYGLHFNDAIQGDGRAFAPMANSLIFDNLTEDTGNEGIQWGSTFDSEIFGNTVRRASLASTDGHMNGIQISDGNRNLAVYANTVDTTAHILSAFTGRRGKDVWVFSNQFYTTRGDGDLNNFLKINQNDTYATVDWWFYHNTIVTATGIPWSIYNTVGNTTVWNKLALVGNLITTSTATTNEQVDSPDVTNLVIDNYQTTNKNGVFFFNDGSKDYRLATLTSPAVATITTVIPSHHWADAYDGYGYAYTATEVNGADSAAMMVALGTPSRTISSIAAQTDVMDVPNGTSFATLVASYLPTTVLATNSDGSSRYVSVTWVEGAYDGDTEDTYTIFGNPSSLPADITNPGVVQAEIDVEVNAPAAPHNFVVAFGSSTNETGYLKTGSGAVFTSAGVDNVFALTDGAGVTNDDLEAVARNIDSTDRWVNRISQTLTFTGPPSLPASVCSSGWNTDVNTTPDPDVPRRGFARIRDKSGGAGLIAQHSYTVIVICARAGTGTRNNDVTVQGSAPQTVDVLGNTTVALTFNNVVPTSGYVEIMVTYNPTGSDGSVNSYLTAAKFDSI